MEEMLQERIGALGLSSVTRMIAFTDDIAPVMNALDVVVHPAVGTEALGLIIWEALASAKPVIASRLDGIPEAFVEGEHGLLVPPADVPALTEAMWALLQRPELRLRFGSAGREHVCRHFSRALHAARMMELYLKLYAPR
jgi:glycosyltransferase involved in cell wall biosynthesis